MIFAFIHMYVRVCVHMCKTWGWHSVVSSVALHFILGGPSLAKLSSVFRLVWLTAVPGISCFYQTQIGLTVESHVYLAFPWVLGTELWHSCFHRKNFAHWAFSPVLTFAFNTGHLSASTPLCLAAFEQLCTTSQGQPILQLLAASLLSFLLAVSPPTLHTITGDLQEEASGQMSTGPKMLVIHALPGLLALFNS